MLSSDRRTAAAGLEKPLFPTVLATGSDVGVGETNGTSYKCLIALHSTIACPT